jgi:RNA polymerase sigma-70 factor (ECF subfamily)
MNSVPPGTSRPGPAGSTPAGDVEARFEALVLPHAGYLYRLAVRLTGRAVDAEDLVQETCVRALRGLDGLRHPDRVRGWLSQILSRLVIDRARGQPPETAVGDLEALDRFSLYDLVQDEDPFPYSDRLHEDFLAQFATDEVRDALLRLPEVFRVPLVLLYTDDLSYAELAEILGCPVGTVMSRLHRGRKLLERQLWDFARDRGLIRTWKR